MRENDYDLYTWATEMNKKDNFIMYDRYRNKSMEFPYSDSDSSSSSSSSLSNYSYEYSDEDEVSKTLKQEKKALKRKREEK